MLKEAIITKFLVSVSKRKYFKLIKGYLKTAGSSFLEKN